jgi:hypothetical protein
LLDDSNNSEKTRPLCICLHERWHVRVRITRTPKEREVDGVSLEGFDPGAVREVSPLVGSWLIAEGYAEAEMRESHDSDLNFGGLAKPVRYPTSPNDRRRRKP